MTNVYRITLGFDPISTLDVLDENLPASITKVLEFLKKNGNDVDETIILGVELLATINPLEIIASEENHED